MLEKMFLVNCHLDEIVFVIFSTGVLLFALLSIMSKDSRNSVISFLMASFVLANIVILICDTIIGIGLAIAYALMSSLFLLMTRMEKNRSLKTKHVIFVTITFIVTSILACLKLNIAHFQQETTVRYEGIENHMVLLISIAFIVVFSGISFLIVKECDNSVSRISN